MKLTVEVTEQDGAAILAWAATPHRVFITSSVPALHMWETQTVTGPGEAEELDRVARVLWNRPYAALTDVQASAVYDAIEENDGTSRDG